MERTCSSDKGEGKRSGIEMIREKREIIESSQKWKGGGLKLKKQIRRQSN